jgi:putative Mg2+ transporter-C (MgtC) family protein
MTGFESQLDVLLIVVLAAALGGIIGLEREVDAHSAGLRTHMLIASTSAALVVLGMIMARQYTIELPEGSLRADPFRLIEAIIVGISIIGGGVILKDEHEHRVKNLTTAASIIFTAIVGIAVGIQFFGLAIGLTFLVLVVNFFFLRVEKRIHPEKRGFFNRRP